MKKMFTTALVLLFAAGLLAQESSIDTLFYDKAWKTVPVKQFATYYRVYMTNGSTPLMYRDYYITGELQGEGLYLTLDKQNDANSIFDGEQISYFKDGKTSQIQNWKDGMLNGTCVTYNEGGQITMNANFVDGKPDGLYSTFDENGTCVNVLMKNGEPALPYYTVSIPNGLSSDYDVTTGELYVKASPTDMKEQIL